MNVIDADLHVLYLSAVGTHRQIEHRFPVGDLLAFGGKEQLRAAAFGVARDVGRVLAVKIVQMGKECPEEGVFFPDVRGQVFAAVYAFPEGFGE